MSLEAPTQLSGGADVSPSSNSAFGGRAVSGGHLCRKAEAPTEPTGETGGTFT